MQPENAADDEAKTEPATDGTEETAAVEPSPILDPGYDHRAMAKRLMAVFHPAEDDVAKVEADPEELDVDTADGALILVAVHALLDIGEQLRALATRPAAGG